ncbi:MAG TPA: PD-(D/E)XK nuclease family protein, partial [Pirellulales bacterium]|nr:PD-(D/E)XK nuclease family protein [Pirellulales bacterium]
SDVRRRIAPARGLRPGREDSALPVPALDPPNGEIESLRVTEFRDYIACPYRYYLRHRLRLRALDDTAPELDGGQFGTILHDVLRRFGEDPVRDSATSEDIREQLFLSLGQLQAEQFGESPMPAVRVQIELLKLRLAEFAIQQASWRRDGWKIKVVERDVMEGEAPFPVDGAPVYLRGRIDRVDFNERDGRHAVLDYKSSETAKTPDAIHRRQGAWIDLQLPLYRHLVKALDIDGEVQLGFVLIPKAVEKTRFELATWTAEELAGADRVAEEVVRGIRRRQFPLAASTPEFFEEFAAICQDDQFGVAGRTAGEPDPEAE